MQNDVQSPARNAMPMTPRLIWHPFVHESYGEQLDYIAISSLSFLMNIEAEISALQALVKHPIAAYETIGFQEVWLRFWAGGDEYNTILGFLRQRVQRLDDINVLVAQPIWRIWGKSVPLLDREKFEANLQRYSPSRLEALQEKWPDSNDARYLISDGLMLGIDGKYDQRSEYIRFMLLIELGAQTVAGSTIADAITNLLSGEEQQSLISLARFRVELRRWSCAVCVNNHGLERPMPRLSVCLRIPLLDRADSSNCAYPAPYPAFPFAGKENRFEISP